MSSTEIARSVPWSRLNPRRKYWLALPSPLCCVTERPGAASRSSPGRVIGRALRSSPLIVIWLARPGGDRGPAPTFGAPGAGTWAAAGCAGADRAGGDGADEPADRGVLTGAL